IQKQLRRKKAQALLVTNANDVRYLSGFTGEDSWLLIKQRSAKITLLSDSRFQEQIRQENPYLTAIIRKQGMIDELKKLIEKEKIAKLALQPEHVTIAMRKVLVKKLGAKTLCPLDAQLVTYRSVKQDIEI